MFTDCTLRETRFGNPFLPLRSRMEGCRFERCDLQGSSFSKVAFEDCAFIDTIFASQRDTDFTDCTFRRCRFENVAMATFQRCTIEDVEIEDGLGSAHFDECTVRRVRVRGGFHGKFVDSDVAACDFSDALFEQASGFVGGRLSDVQMPKGARGYLVRYRDLLLGLEAALPALRDETQGRLLQLGQATRTSQAIGPVEDDFFRDLTHEEQTAVLEALLPFRVDRV